MSKDGKLVVVSLSVSLLGITGADYILSKALIVNEQIYTRNPMTRMEGSRESDNNREQASSPDLVPKSNNTIRAINLSRDNRVGCGEGRTTSIVMWPDAVRPSPHPTGYQLSRLKRVAPMSQYFQILNSEILAYPVTPLC